MHFTVSEFEAHHYWTKSWDFFIIISNKFPSYQIHFCSSQIVSQPFDLEEGLASYFSLQYCPWITHEGHTNKQKDHQLK